MVMGFSIDIVYQPPVDGLHLAGYNGLTPTTSVILTSMEPHEKTCNICLANSFYITLLGIHCVLLLDLSVFINDAGS